MTVTDSLTEQTLPNGVLLIDKPEGFTSFDVIAVLRKILHERRLGHTGTLDPMATGVLPILVGRATKAADILPSDEKIYRAGFTFGISTDTEDITGSVLKESVESVSCEKLNRILPLYTGEINQTPPMYSAVSVGGKRLYELARKGVSVERPSRAVKISELKLESYDEQSRTGEIFVRCSKGTYVRTLISDIGNSLGVGGCMTSLRRLSSQGFDISDCIPLLDLKALPQEKAKDMAVKRIIPVDSLFECYERITLSQRLSTLYSNGVKLRTEQAFRSPAEGIFRVYDFSGSFVGLCESKDGVVSVYKNFR